MSVRELRATMMSAAAVWALCASGALAQTNIEFIQWWEPEMPAGALRGIMDDFEAANPDIKVTLVSGPYSATHDQIVVGAASGTLSDVVGLDGAWVNGLAKQGAIASMDPLMDAAGYDRSQIADIIQVDGQSYMFPLASFVYPVFVNLDLEYHIADGFALSVGGFLFEGLSQTVGKNLYTLIGAQEESSNVYVRATAWF